MIIHDFGPPPRGLRKAERPSPNDEESARVSRKRQHLEAVSFDCNLDSTSDSESMAPEPCSPALPPRYVVPSILASGHAPSRLPPVLVCFGDSFLKPFSYGFRDSHVRALSISGATARSLGKLESRSGSNRLITQLLTEVHECDFARFSHCRSQTVPMLFMCGHVDLYFNLYQKMFDEHWIDARAYLRESVERYVAFLATLHARWPRLSTVYVCSAFLPVVREEDMLDSLKYYFLSQSEERISALLRVRPEVASLEWRAANVHFFNDLLEKACDAHRAAQPEGSRAQLVFLDVNVLMLDARGRISSRFLMDDPCNVHVKWGVTLPYWLRLLEPVGLRRPHLLQRPLGYVDGRSPRRLLLAARRYRSTCSRAITSTRSELTGLMERSFPLPPFQTQPAKL